MEVRVPVVTVIASGNVADRRLAALDRGSAVARSVSIPVPVPGLKVYSVGIHDSVTVVVDPITDLLSIRVDVRVLVVAVFLRHEAISIGIHRSGVWTAGVIDLTRVLRSCVFD
jgi:hypothetical protein